MYFSDDPLGRCILGMLSVALPSPSLIMMLPLFNTWAQVTFGVGVPLAAQSSVRVSPSLMVLLEGRELVNLGGTMTTRVGKMIIDWPCHSNFKLLYKLQTQNHAFLLLWGFTMGPSQPLLCFCLHLGTQFITKLLQICTKKYLHVITKRNS